MKLLLRVSVLSLLVTGAFLANSNQASANVKPSMKSAIPVPSCPPGNGQTCGIENF
jgi:hypothetical protein